MTFGHNPWHCFSPHFNLGTIMYNAVNNKVSGIQRFNSMHTKDKKIYTQQKCVLRKVYGTTVVHQKWRRGTNKKLNLFGGGGMSGVLTHTHLSQGYLWLFSGITPASTWHGTRVSSMQDSAFTLYLYGVTISLWPSFCKF